MNYNHILLLCMALLFLLSGCNTEKPDAPPLEEDPLGTKPPGLSSSHFFSPTGKVTFWYSFKKGRPFEKLHQGAELHSEYIDYKIKFEPDEDCYVHIYQATSDGQCVPLLKKYEIENKVIANRAYFFPAQYEAFILNKSPGVETIYFVASREADDLFGKTYSFCNRLTSADEHSLSRNYHGIECNLDCLKKVTFKHKPQKEEER